MMFHPVRAIALLLALCSPPALAGSPVHLSSLDWPPYTGSTLEQQGCLTILVKEAFARAGLEAQVDLYPWSRVLAQSRDPQARQMAFFPAYYAESREQEYYISDPIGEGPVGFIEDKNAPLHWKTLDDLRDKRIGVVQDYVNTPDFDARAAKGDLHTESVVSDALNVRKMLGHRIDTAVIDSNVLKYLVDNEPELAAGRTTLQINPHLLDQKKLYVYFRRTPEGLKLRDAFNAGLKQALDAYAAKGNAHGTTPPPAP